MGSRGSKSGRSNSERSLQNTENSPGLFLIKAPYSPGPTRRPPGYDFRRVGGWVWEAARPCLLSRLGTVPRWRRAWSCSEEQVGGMVRGPPSGPCRGGRGEEGPLIKRILAHSRRPFGSAQVPEPHETARNKWGGGSRKGTGPVNKHRCKEDFPGAFLNYLRAG